MLRSSVRAMRPHQWVKNLFVLAPLVFAQELTDVVMALRALLATVIFCLAASAVYMANDIVDVKADREHPTKSRRPIASGSLPLHRARLTAAALAGFAAFGALALGWQFACLTLLYLLLSAFYNSATKRIAYADVLSIAAGFELRVLAGAAAARVDASLYLCVVTFLLALYLGLGKRLHELLLGGSPARREALREYRVPHLKRGMAATGAATFGIYLLYSFDPSVQMQLGTRFFAATGVFALWGLHRFYYLANRSSHADSPTERMLRDFPFMANLALWAGCVLLLLYWPG